MDIGIRDLTEGGIFKQLTKLALPIMATSFVQMAYSLTDMAWVGRLGSEAVAAIGAVGILLWLTSSGAILSKVGAEVSIAQSIGAKKMNEARIYASHTSTIAFIISLLFGIILFFGADHIIAFFKLEASIAENACNYLRLLSTALPFVFLSLTFSGIYNATGRSTIPFYLTALGLVCNMILDPLFIFGIGFIPSMGIQGAAYATWISQAFVFCLFVWQMKQDNGVLNRFPYLIKPIYTYTLRIVQLGFPVAMMNLIFAFMNMYLARIASIYGGHIGVTSQTTGGQIEGITWNTSQGFSTALSAFVAQNYAANKMERAKRAYLYTILLMSSLGLFVSIAFVFFGETIFGVLVPQQEAKIAGGEYLAIVGISQIFMMLELTTQGMFNGVGRTLPPAIISISLNAARIPFALLLASQMGVVGVWWAISISSFLKGIIIPWWFSRVYKDISKSKKNKLDTILEQGGSLPKKADNS
ncbi:MATE family efflux transporter [Bacteroidales bacterium]|nr:MATE family efflux transporter [Bacteroidales bacterium]